MNNLDDEMLTLKEKIRSVEEKIRSVEEEIVKEIEVAEGNVQIELMKKENSLRNELVSLRNVQIELMKEKNIRLGMNRGNSYCGG